MGLWLNACGLVQSIQYTSATSLSVLAAPGSIPDVMMYSLHLAYYLLVGVHMCVYL